MLKTTNSVIDVSQITGTLPVANGGTGLTTLTAGYIPYGNGTSALGSSSNLFWDSSNNRMYIGATSLGLTTTASVPLFMVGQMLAGASNTTANNNKDFRYAAGAYTGNAATIINFSGQSAVNNIYYGGNTGAGEPATAHYWYTGTAGTLGAGTEKMRLFNAGGLSIGNTTDPGATNLSVTGSTSSASFIPSSSTVPTNGVFLPTTNTIGFSTNSTERIRVLSTGELCVGSTTALRSGFATIAASGASYNQLVLADTVAYNASPTIEQDFTGKYNSGGTYATFAAIRGAKLNTTDADQNGTLSFWTNNGSGITQKLTISNTGNIYGLSGSTSATDGFFYIPSAAGAPSGTPTSVSGRVPMYYDSTNNKFYVYNGAWKGVTLA